MPDYRVLATNHTSFTVSSLDRSLPFFVEVLGFEIFSRVGRDPATIALITGVPGAAVEIAYLRGRGHTVELIEYKGPAERSVLQSRPCDTGSAHLAFDVVGIDLALVAAEAHGFHRLSPDVVTARAGGPNAGARVIYLRDEDGVTIEFIEKLQR